ncbi:hypothetical protein [Streptomyces mirabilis]|uniref:hypothetical protein n=1 Tax=Streptomyces mirabilis TaxID=68239 RepID=UPI00368772F5
MAGHDTTLDDGGRHGGRDPDGPAGAEAAPALTTAVHDPAAKDCTHDVENQGGGGVTAHDAFDSADERATAVNNKGLEAQLWLLAQCYGEQAVHALLAQQAGASASDA